MRVRSQMTRNVYTVEPDVTLSEIHDLMDAMDIRHIPVVEGRRLVGIVSDRDVLRWAVDVGGELIVPEIAARDVMTRDVVVCHEATTVDKAAESLLHHKIDCLPVVEQGELVGLLTSSDLLEILCSSATGGMAQTIPINWKVHGWSQADRARTHRERGERPRVQRMT